MTFDPLDSSGPAWFEDPGLTPEQRAAGAEFVERIRRPIGPGDPRAHHFIPRWFLKRFANDDKRLVRIPLSDPSKPSPPTAVEKVAQMRDWYTYDDVDVGPTVLIEKILAEVDGTAKWPFQRLSAPGGHFFPPSDADRIEIAKWLAFQAVRGPGHRRRIEAMADMTAKMTIDPEKLKKFAVARLAEQGNTDPTPEDIEEYSRLQGVEADPGRAFLLGTMLDSALRLIPVILQRHIAVVRFPATGLLLPDEPLNRYQDPERSMPGVGVGYLNADEIQIPIDRSTALVLHSDDDVGDRIIEIPDDRIDEFNAAVVWNAHSELYAHPNDVYRLDRIELPTADRPVMHANGADFIRAHVDGLNEPAERRSARRFRNDQPPATSQSPT